MAPERNWSKGIRTLYSKYERHIGTLTIITGFIFDNLTLREASIDAQTMVFIIYLILSGVSILFLHFLESREKKENKGYLHFWVFLLMQFTIGGLFSMFFVFYSRGFALSASWPFLLFLFANLVGNELLKKEYTRLSLQVSLYFIGIFSFFIYYIPVILHEMDDKIFIYSGLASLITVFIFMRLLELIYFKRVNRSRLKIGFGVLTFYILINIFYFTNVIPPVPLVMKDGGVYHNLSVNNRGDYIAYKEPISEWNIFNEYPAYNKIQGESVYVITSVYAPAKFGTQVIHDWQYYNENSKKWISASRIFVPIIGGREGGYRFYSVKQNITPGIWRVDVETLRGQNISRIKFEIVDADFTPNFEQVIY
ncbi:MAG: DUF2914 domain-containing protein [Candidatus Paceibacterota bacterium]